MSAQRSRVEQRDHLLTALGFVLDPVRRLVENIDDERRRVHCVEAEFDTDCAAFLKELSGFCRIGSHGFMAAYHDIRRLLQRRFGALFRQIRSGTIDQQQAILNFNNVVSEAHCVIRAIPCDDPGTIFPSESPFKTYLRLRATSASATARLDILDPYLTADVFHRYLTDVAETAQISVVTSDKVMCGSDTVRRDRIVAVSELLARERPTTYRFLVSNALHDRHCRADDSIFHLGGSAAHASFVAPYTISTLGPANHAALDAIIAGATEWFGPTLTVHRRS